MDFYTKYKSPLGYQTGENQVDTYGVDHSGFSTRDELEYQFARQNKENQLIRNYNNQGITKNYPQQGTNFWGNPDNNYSFGSSNKKVKAKSMTMNGTNMSGEERIKALINGQPIIINVEDTDTNTSNRWK